MNKTGHKIRITRTDRQAKRALIMAASDTVAIALDDLASGDRVTVKSLHQKTIDELEVLGPLPFGHKLSVKALAKGSEVIKNGEVIGIASKSIRRGEHVHIQNVISSIVPPPATAPGTRQKP